MLQSHVPLVTFWVYVAGQIEIQVEMKFLCLLTLISYNIYLPSRNSHRYTCISSFTSWCSTLKLVSQDPCSTGNWRTILMVSQPGCLSVKPDLPSFSQSLIKLLTKHFATSHLNCFPFFQSMTLCSTFQMEMTLICKSLKCCSCTIGLPCFHLRWKKKDLQTVRSYDSHSLRLKLWSHACIQVSHN